MVDVDMSNPDVDLGSIIKDQVAQSIKNLDVVSLLKKLSATVSDDKESEDIRQRLEGILGQYNSMPEQQKAQFAEQLKEVLANKLAMKLKDSPIDFSGVEDAIKEAVVSQLYFIAAGVFVFIVILVFFGYKLYKSIKDKEKKREEKKKLKQMKKKK